jgi:hypothetical protein
MPKNTAETSDSPGPELLDQACAFAGTPLPNLDRVERDQVRWKLKHAKEELMGR